MNCRKCNRQLSDIGSLAKGFGPECSCAVSTQARAINKAEDLSAQIPKERFADLFVDAAPTAEDINYDKIAKAKTEAFVKKILSKEDLSALKKQDETCGFSMVEKAQGDRVYKIYYSSKLKEYNVLLANSEEIGEFYFRRATNEARELENKNFQKFLARQAKRQALLEKHENEVTSYTDIIKAYWLTQFYHCFPPLFADIIFGREGKNAWKNSLSRRKREIKKIKKLRNREKYKRLRLDVSARAQELYEKELSKQVKLKAKLGGANGK